MDAETYFALPFCTQQASCFNGVLGAITPYGNVDLGKNIFFTFVGICH